MVAVRGRITICVTRALDCSRQGVVLAACHGACGSGASCQGTHSTIRPCTTTIRQHACTDARLLVIRHRRAQRGWYSPLLMSPQHQTPPLRTLSAADARKWASVAARGQSKVTISDGRAHQLVAHGARHALTAVPRAAARAAKTPPPGGLSAPKARRLGRTR